jgi:hypothetical protein
MKERSGKIGCEVVEAGFIVSDWGTLGPALGGKQDKKKIRRLKGFSCEFHWLVFHVDVLCF